MSRVSTTILRPGCHWQRSNPCVPLTCSPSSAVVPSTSAGGRVRATFSISSSTAKKAERMALDTASAIGGVRGRPRMLWWVAAVPVGNMWQAAHTCKTPVTTLQSSRHRRTLYVWLQGLQAAAGRQPVSHYYTHLVLQPVTGLTPGGWAASVLPRRRLVSLSARQTLPPVMRGPLLMLPIQAQTGLVPTSPPALLLL
jgi:hypothetical protein